MKSETKPLFVLFFSSFALSFLCSACFASFNPPRVQGNVFDPENSSIAGAIIVLYNENSSLVDYTLSLDDGFFSFQPEPGNYFIVASFSNYNSKRSSVFYFDGNNTLKVDFLLMKTPTSLSEAVSNFWSNFGGIIAIGVSLFTFWLGMLIEKNRSKNERMEKIKSTILYPLAARVRRVLKHHDDLESIILEKNGSDPVVINQLTEMLERLKSDAAILENKLHQVLFENELVSYLPEKKTKEYYETWENLSWFCEEFLQNYMGVIIASILRYFKGEKPNDDENKLGDLFSSLKRLQNSLVAKGE
jgi:hypothetical protein